MFKNSFLMFNFCSRRLLSGKRPSGFDWAKQEKVLMAPFDYIHQNVPAKYTALMAPSFDHWLQIPKQKLDAVQEIMHTCMTWSMLTDDIEDGSNYRFGIPSAHRVFGEGLTINAANKALLLSQKQVAELEHPLALEEFWKVHEEYFYGAGVDFYWRENHIVPTEEALWEMALRKSGSWFSLPVRLMQLLSDNKTDYRDLATDIGGYYTMVDDYFNLFLPHKLQTLSQSAKLENYAPANDITESKMTLAIVHASQFPDVATELIDILKQKTSDLNLINRALELLKKHGSDEYCREVLRKIDSDLRKEINRLGGNPKLVAFLDGLRLY